MATQFRVTNSVITRQIKEGIEVASNKEWVCLCVYECGNVYVYTHIHKVHTVSLEMFNRKGQDPFSNLAWERTKFLSIALSDLKSHQLFIAENLQLKK